MTPEFVTIASPQLRAEINPFGAELSRLQDAPGRDLLWDGDPAWWAGRAPLLFPIVGRLPDDRFAHAGERFELPKHGFARRRGFTLVEQAPGRARFRLAADGGTRAAYPFDFALEIAFEICGPELRMTAQVANLGAEPMPATFGFHPAFRWPLPGAGARADHAITFAEPESGPLRRLDRSALLGPARLPSPVEGRRLGLRDELFVEDALIFEDLASRSLRYGAGEGPALAISWRGLPHLGVWTKPGAPYVCIEPWLSLPAGAGHAGSLGPAPTVAPRETLAVSMSVGFAP